MDLSPEALDLEKLIATSAISLDAASRGKVLINMVSRVLGYLSVSWGICVDG